MCVCVVGLVSVFYYKYRTTAPKKNLGNKKRKKEGNFVGMSGSRRTSPASNLLASKKKFFTDFPPGEE